MTAALDRNLFFVRGHLGSFQQKLFSIGGKLELLDVEGSPLCMLAGSWTGWNFRFMRGDRQLAHVTKKWSGLGKVLEEG